MYLNTYIHIHIYTRVYIGGLVIRWTYVLQHVGQGEMANSYKVMNNRLIQAQLIYNVGLFVLPTAFGIIFS